MSDEAQSKRELVNPGVCSPLWPPPSAIHDVRFNAVWVSCADGLSYLTSKLGAPEKAKHTLTHQLRIGAVRSAADAVLDEDDKGPIGPLPATLATNGKKLGLRTPQGLPRHILGLQFWLDDVNLHLDQTRWDWQEGIAIATYIDWETNLPKRKVVYGLFFDAKSLDLVGINQQPKIFEHPAKGITTNIVAKKNESYGRKISPKWAPWVAELTALIHEEGLNGLSSESLCHLVNAKLPAEEQMKFGTVKPLLLEIIRRFGYLGYH